MMSDNKYKKTIYYLNVKKKNDSIEVEEGVESGFSIMNDGDYFFNSCKSNSFLFDTEWPLELKCKLIEIINKNYECLSEIKGINNQCEIRLEKNFIEINGRKTVREYTYLSYIGANNSSQCIIKPYITDMKEIGFFVNLKTETEKYETLKAGLYDIVFSEGWNGMIFHEACGHCLEGDNIVTNNSIFTPNDIGKQVAMEEVTLIDDPHLHEGGLLGIDDEGNETKKIILIENGILKNFLTTEKNSRDLNIRNTCRARREKYSSKPLPRMTNTYLQIGGQDNQKIPHLANNGILVKRVGAGNVNIKTGDFSFWVLEAYRIHEGELGKRLPMFLITDNSKRFLNNIFAVGKNLKIESGFCKKGGQVVPVGCGQPMIGVSKVFVGMIRN